MLFVVTLLAALLWSISGSASPLQPSANDLARKVIDNESKAEAADQSHWMFRLETKKAGKDELKEVVETKVVDLDCLISVNGRPLTPANEQREQHRLQQLIDSPRELRELEKAKAEDMERMRRLLKLLPDAFNFSYGTGQGDLTQLKFTPNPSFRPPSREARVFHAMEGEMWVNSKQARLVEISGRLVREVKFGGGLLGRLAQGGEFQVKQAEVAPGYWELASLKVHMRGRALLFKSIGVEQDELRNDYHRLPDDLTVARGLQLLHINLSSARTQ